MTRIDDSDGCDMHCHRSDHNQIRVVNHLRVLAHEKHGSKSVESVPGLKNCGGDRFAAILTEEVGEIANVLNEFALGNLLFRPASYALARELYDVMVVVSAWLDAIGCGVPDRIDSGVIWPGETEKKDHAFKNDGAGCCQICEAVH